VGPALFFSLLVITLSFVPVFALEAQEGRLFAPLAFTKTYAMAAAAGLAVTLIPVLMGYLIRGRILEEHRNPINRWLVAAYRPILDRVLRYPKTTLAIAAIALAATLVPVTRLGGEFLPPLYEGDLLYMPTALPGISPSKAAELLQQTDRIIATVPEVARVFGKVGRAETATDPAPLEMVETTVQLKPREQWRAGMTPEKLVEELDKLVRLPGLANIWIPPIRNRIDMLATGIKSPLGIKVSGNALPDIERVAATYARRNLSDASLTNARVETSAVGEWLARHAAELGRADFILLDPPRAGAEPDTVRAIINLKPRHISYVSCDPATLARDLRLLLDAGYYLHSLRAFDLFPQTHHVETVVHLSMSQIT